MADAAKKYAADRTAALLKSPVMRVSWETLELELEKAYEAGLKGFAEILANPPRAFLEATGQYTDEDD